MYQYPKQILTIQQQVQSYVDAEMEIACVVDCREFEGSVQEQMEAAFRFVLEKINRGMKIIEKWGSGIPRIIRECKEGGLPEPEFIDFDGDFRVNMFRRTTSGMNGINDTKNETNETNETIALRLIRENPSITQKEMKDKMGVSLVTVKRLISDLKTRGRIQRKGSNRSGTWQVKDSNA